MSPARERLEGVLRSRRGLAATADRESRRLAAAAWLYHFGITSFSRTEHAEDAPKSGGPLLGLLVRDIAFAGTSLLSGSRVRRAALALTVASDLSVLRAISKHVPRHVVAEDRSLSQFGLTWGVAALLDPFPGSKTVAYTAPAVSQLAIARIWRFPRRSTARYISTEYAWSFAVLRVASQLRERVVQASQQKAMDSAEANATAERLARQETVSSFYNAVVHNLRVDALNAMYLVAADANTDPERLVDDLQQVVEAETARYRRFAQGAEATLGDVLSRLALHRRLRGLSTDFDSTVQGAWRTPLGTQPQEELDHLVDAELSAISEPICLTVDPRGPNGDLLAVKNTMSTRRWEVALV